MRDFGSIRSPQNAFYLNLGLESLHVRVISIARMAGRIAEGACKQSKVAHVSCPQWSSRR